MKLSPKAQMVWLPWRRLLDTHLWVRLQEQRLQCRMGGTADLVADLDTASDAVPDGPTAHRDHHLLHTLGVDRLVHAARFFLPD